MVALLGSLTFLFSVQFLLFLHYWQLSSHLFSLLKKTSTLEFMLHIWIINSPSLKRISIIMLLLRASDLSNPPSQNQNLPELCFALSYLRGIMQHTNVEAWLLLLSVRNKWIKVPLQKSLSLFEANTEKFNEEWVPTQWETPAPSLRQFHALHSNIRNRDLQTYKC